MATFLDISLLSRAELIFAFIFVWVGVYAVLLHTKWLGDKKNNIYAILAFAIALMTISTRSVLKVISVTIPWFVFMMLIAVMIILALMALGYSKGNITSTLMSREWSTPIVIWIVIISLIIVVAGLGSVFFTGDSEFSSDTNTTITLEDGTITTGDVGSRGSGALFATIFHPKVLGLIVVLLIGALVVQFLGKGSLD
jgi:hypothetical protein